MSRSQLGVLCALLAGCAFGDGRGHATVEGDLSVSLESGSFTAASGQVGALSAVTVTIAQLELAADHVGSTGTEHVTSIIPIGASWSPLAGLQTVPFGPLEVLAGDYSRLVILVHSLVIKGTLGEQEFELMVVPAAGIRVETAADLPVNRDHAPNIEMAATFEMPDALLDGTDPIGDPEGTALVVAARLSSSGLLSADWSRTSD